MAYREFENIVFSRRSLPGGRLVYGRRPANGAAASRWSIFHRLDHGNGQQGGGDPLANMVAAMAGDRKRRKLSRKGTGFWTSCARRDRQLYRIFHDQAAGMADDVN
jgi:hypothetical protein